MSYHIKCHTTLKCDVKNRCVKWKSLHIQIGMCEMLSAHTSERYILETKLAQCDRMHINVNARGFLEIRHTNIIAPSTYICKKICKNSHNSEWFPRANLEPDASERSLILSESIITDTTCHKVGLGANANFILFTKVFVWYSSVDYKFSN
jgi:hypothetical protein